MYCPKCGNILPDLANFCDKCGETLTNLKQQVQEFKQTTPLTHQQPSKEQSTTPQFIQQQTTQQQSIQTQPQPYQEQQHQQHQQTTQPSMEQTTQPQFIQATQPIQTPTYIPPQNIQQTTQPQQSVYSSQHQEQQQIKQHTTMIPQIKYSNKFNLKIASIIVVVVLLTSGLGITYWWASGLTSTGGHAPPLEKTSIEISNWKLDTVNNEFLTCFAHLYGSQKVKAVFSTLTIEWKVKQSEQKTVLVTLDVGKYANKIEKSVTFPRTPLYDDDMIKTSSWGSSSAEGTEWGDTDIELNPSFNSELATVSSPINVGVELKITDVKNNSIIHADTKNINFLPLNYYSWGLLPPSIDSSYIYDPESLVVVLSTPHADVVQKILSDASKKIGDNALRGYQEKQGYTHQQNVDEQMKAIYDAIIDRKVTYVNTPITFSDIGGQRIKTPLQVMSDLSGNCIELSLLFVSCFEAIGFHARLIFPPGHAFVGVRLWDEGNDTTYIVVLETTMVASSGWFSNYNDAKTTAEDEYKDIQNDNIVYIPQIRDLGIMPVPYLDK